MTNEPVRLSESESPLAQLLRGAQQDALTPQAVERVQAGLVSVGLLGALATTSVTTAWWVRLMKLTSVKWGLSLTGLSLLAVGGWQLASRQQDSSAKPVASAPAVSEPAASASSASVARAASAASASRGSVASASSAPAVDAISAASASPSARRLATARIAATAAVASATPSQPTAPTPREGALLLEARRALELEPRRALALVKQHEREFPKSQLAPERLRIAAEAARRAAP